MVQMTRRGIRTRLPEDFAPGKFTVLCGRGKEYTSSTGNKHLKSLVHKYLKPYSGAQSKIAKSSIVSEIMGQIKGHCSGPAFVKLEKEAWWEVDDAFAREKIGCMFRDILHTQYRSSTKAKFARKKAKKEIAIRRDSSLSIDSIQSMVSTQSSSSTESYASSYAAEIFGKPGPVRVEKAKPAVFNPLLSEYYSLLSSYLTPSGPNQQQQPRQPKNAYIPVDFCVMPMAPQTPQLDDFPDDLSGIFDDC